ncbi:MAG: GAP family protein [Actinomycetota bacterium]
MSDLALELVPVAVAIAVSPFPLIPVVLLLLTGRPLANGGSFLAGWSGGLLVLAAAFTAAASAVELWDETPTWASWTRLVLGIVLIALGARKWVTGGGKAEAPAWMAALGGYSPAQSLRLGFLLAVANPKVILLVLAGGVAIGSAELGMGRAVAAVVLFSVVAASAVALPILLRLVLGSRTDRPLDAARRWLVTHNDAVVSVVVIAIGVMLVLKGVGGL